jgi:hypothetical protein
MIRGQALSKFSSRRRGRNSHPVSDPVSFIPDASYNSVTEQGQTFRVAAAGGRCGSNFDQCGR